MTDFAAWLEGRACQSRCLTPQGVHSDCMTLRNAASAWRSEQYNAYACASHPPHLGHLNECTWYRVDPMCPCQHPTGEAREAVGSVFIRHDANESGPVDGTVWINDKLNHFPDGEYPVYAAPPGTVPRAEYEVLKDAAQEAMTTYMTATVDPPIVGWVRRLGIALAHADEVLAGRKS